ncbi:MAG TPA: type II secretion system F family protein [Desulfobacteria bacterium]|nr:type II secretion system F family protein [Desulfobacteria bacterium]
MNLAMTLIMVFLTVTLFVYGVFLMVTSGRRELERRMRTYTARIGELDRGINPLQRIKTFNLKVAFREASQIFSGKAFTKKMESELLKAEVPLRGEEYIMLNVLLVIGLSFMALVLTRTAVLAWLGGIVGFVAPKILLSRLKAKRIQKFNSQIGDSLVVMSNSLRAGFSFLQSMEMVSREMPSPISDEFAHALREMNLGTPTEEALVNLTNRVDSEDIDLVITAVLIQRQVGGNLAEVLDSISHTIRERVRIKGEIKTLTAQGRVSGIIVGILPVVIGLILSVINPSYIGVLFTNQIGWAFIAAGVISQTVGIALIKKTVDIKI